MALDSPLDRLTAVGKTSAGGISWRYKGRFCHVRADLADPIQRHEGCLDAWKDNLSNPGERAVPDAMREIRTPEYSRALLNIAISNDSAGIREWEKE